jgi:outer membrane lipoprotein-sorting protein
MKYLHHSCELWAERISLAAAGCLSPDEEREVRRHIETCCDCRERFRQLTQLCGALAEARLPAADVAAAIVERVMSAVASDESERPVVRTRAGMTHGTLLSRSPNIRRWIMRLSVSRVAAAVVFVVALGGVALWFHGGGATVSFADVVERFLGVKSYQMKATDQFDGELLHSYDSMWIAPGRSRREFKSKDGGIERVAIGDATSERTKGIIFSPEEKVAEIMEIVNLPDRQTFFDEAHSLMLKARERTTEATPLGEKVIDGRQAIGYRLKLEKYNTQQDIWADVKTLLPVRIEITTVGKTPEKKVLKSIWSDIQYNLKLDESLFSLDPPAGYKVVKHKPVVLPKQSEGEAKESAPMNSETVGLVGVEEKMSDEELWGKKKDAADAKKDASKSKESVPGTLLPMVPGTTGPKK